MTSHRMSIRDLRDRVPIAVLEGVLRAIVKSSPGGVCPKLAVSIVLLVKERQNSTHAIWNSGAPPPGNQI